MEISLEPMRSPALKKELRSSLSPGNPLGSWKFFPEPVRPLAFAVRVPILLALDQDIYRREVVEQPWDQLARSLQPKYRVRFMMANCRALLAGKKHLRRVSSLCIASCMAMAMKGNLKSELSGVSEPDQQTVVTLARLCIIRLGNEIVNMWREGSPRYWKAYSSTGTVNELENGIQTSGFPRNLTAAFKHPKAKYRNQAVLIMLSLEDGSPTITAHRQNVVSLAVSDEDSDVRKAATLALCALGSKAIDSVILQDMLSKLQAHPICNGQYVLELFVSLADEGLVGEELIEDVLVGLADLLFRRRESGVQKSNMHLLDRIVQKDDHQTRFEAAIKEWILKDLSEEGSARMTAFETVDRLWFLCSASGSLRLTVHSCQRIVKPLVDRLVTCAMSDSDADVRLTGQATIKLLLDAHILLYSRLLFGREELFAAEVAGSLCKTLEPALASDDWSIRLDAIEFIRKHCADFRLGNLIDTVLPSVIQRVLDDDDEDVQGATIAFLGELLDDGKYTPRLASLMLSDLEKWLDSDIQEQLVPLLAKLLQKENSAEEQGLKYFLRVIFATEDEDVWAASLNAILSQCDSHGGRVVESVRDMLPKELFFEYGEEDTENSEELNISARSDEGERWEMVLLYLMRNESVRGDICDTLQSRLRPALTRTPEVSAEGDTYNDREQPLQVHVLHRVCGVLATVARKHNVSDFVRIAAVRTLHTMLEQGDAEIAWKCFKDLGHDLLDDSDPDVRQTYLKLIATIPEKYDAMEIIPKLLALPNPASYFWRNLEALEVLGRRENVARALIQEFKPDLVLINAKPWWTRMKYAKLLGTLAKAGDFVSAISQLVTLSIKDEDDDVRRTSLEGLTALTAQRKNSHIDSALKAEIGKNRAHISTVTSTAERMAWTNALAALSIHASDLDPQVHHQLVKLAVGDSESNIRNAAYEGLRCTDAKLQDHLSTALATGFTTLFVIGDSNKFQCYSALIHLKSDCLEKPVKFNFSGVLRLLAGPLLKTALNDKSVEVREAAQGFLRSWISHQEPNESLQNAEHSSEVKESYVQIISAIPALLREIANSIPSFSEKDRAVVLQLLDAVQPNISGDVISPFTESVLKMLTDSHGPIQSMALEICGVLHRKELGRKLIHSSVTEVLNIAIEDNKEHPRVVSLQLLLKLCDDSSSLVEIRAAQPQLMRLLENSTLRPAAIDLISALCNDAKVRQSVLQWMLTRLSANSEREVEGALALLSGLVVEKRPSIESQSPDLLFFLLPVFVLNPRMAKVRSRITALLWCNYQNLAREGLDKNQKVPELLIDSLVGSVFGHHVAQHELDVWKGLEAYMEPSELADS